MSQDSFGDALAEILKLYANKPMEIQNVNVISTVETTLGDNSLTGTDITTTTPSKPQPKVPSVSERAEQLAKELQTVESTVKETLVQENKKMSLKDQLLSLVSRPSKPFVNMAMFKKSAPAATGSTLVIGDRTISLDSNVPDTVEKPAENRTPTEVMIDAEVTQIMSLGRIYTCSCRLEMRDAVAYREHRMFTGHTDATSYGTFPSHLGRIVKG